MSDDYFGNNYDSEYWNDVYYEEHKNEYGSGYNYSGGIFRYFIFLMLMTMGLLLAAICPPVGALIILAAYGIRDNH